MIGSLDGVNKNSAKGRYIRELEKLLTEHVGGSPPITQQLLIERIIKIKLTLEAFEVKLVDGNWTPHDSRTYGGLSNAFRLTIRELGIKPHKAARIPSLGEIVTTFKGPPAPKVRGPQGPR